MTAEELAQHALDHADAAENDPTKNPLVQSNLALAYAVLAQGGMDEALKARLLGMVERLSSPPRFVPPPTIDEKFGVPGVMLNYGGSGELAHMKGSR